MTALLLSEIFPPHIGGSARWFWELYRRMPRADVVIAAGACAGDAEFDRRHDLRVTRLALSLIDGGAFDPATWLAYGRAARAVRRLCRRADVRAVHCGRVLPEGWLALTCGRPFGCFVHGEELISNRTSRQLTWMTKRVLPRAALLIANSRHTAALLERGWGVSRERISVLAPGVDTAHFVPASRDEQARAALGWVGRLVVLTVARLQKRKGHDHMIDAIALLRPRLPNLLYAIVGDGAERSPLEERVRQAGVAEHVRFHGALDDQQLVRAYQQCDVFALPNRTVDGDLEGFGMVLLEAQACARPVLAGDSGGTSEALCDGESGVIVDCTSPRTLAAAVGALLEDGARRERMGAAGRRRMVEHFDFDRRAALAVEVLARVRQR